jgi:hypothetical protein
MAKKKTTSAAKKSGTKGKSTKKASPAKRPAPAATKKPAIKAKPPAKKTAVAAGKPPAKSAPASGMSQVSTGSGASAGEVGRNLVAMFNAGKGEDVEKKYWASGITSIEGMGMAWHGLKAVREKNARWMGQNEVLGGSAEGPYVGATGFAVKFRIHIRERATGKEDVMEEVGVYTVRDGKIVTEEFMYLA